MSLTLSKRLRLKTPIWIRATGGPLYHLWRDEQGSLFPIIPPTIPPVTVSLTANAVDPTNLTIYNGAPFQSLAFGTASPSRKIVVGIGHHVTTASTVSSLTIGGISATKVTDLQNGNGGAELWQANVPTGATGNVFPTFAKAVDSCGIGVWAVYDALDTADATASNSADPMTATLNIPANGIGIGYVKHTNGGDPTIWTNLTTRFDQVMEGNDDHTGASDAFSTLQSGLSITANPPSGVVDNAMVLASWGPR